MSVNTNRMPAKVDDGASARVLIGPTGMFGACVGAAAADARGGALPASVEPPTAKCADSVRAKTSAWGMWPDVSQRNVRAVLTPGTVFDTILRHASIRRESQRGRGTA